MKKMKFFAMALAVLTIVSCSKESVDTTTEKGISLALKIDQVSTRAIQTPGTIGGAPSSMIIELFDAAKNKLGAKSLTSEEITEALKSIPTYDAASRIVIESIDARTEFVKIWAYQKAGITAVNDLTKGVNDHQMVFNEIPFYPVAQAITGTIFSTTDADGFISVNKTAQMGTATHATHKIWTVQAKLEPYFARFELAPAVGGVKPDMNLIDGFPTGTTFTVTGIYMNDIMNTKSAAGTTKYGNNSGNFGNGDWDALGVAAYKENGAWDKMCNISGAHSSTTALSAGSDCYNLFAQAGSPHVVVRVWVDLPTTGVDYYGFVTIGNFKIDEDKDLSVEGIKAGKIYQINLGALRALKPADVTPDPESKAADLYASVTIVDWAIITGTPELN